jgi:hypothetical protein
MRWPRLTCNQVILIELVYETGCPRVAEVRARLAWALTEARVSQRWTEWNLAGGNAPFRVSGFSSPTILINERPVAASNPLDASTKYAALPSISQIVETLAAARTAAPDILPHRLPRPPRKRRKRPR